MIFDAWRDDGYGEFIHISSRFKRRRDVWGGEYGPYIMARYTKSTGNGCQIFYTLSTWNPYQVVIMRSDLRLAEMDRSGR